MKRLLFLFVFLALAGGGGYAYYKYGRKPIEPTINTGAISRGSIVDTVGTTGALSAVSQVQVGSQVSGIILELGADFNSIVKKGQVLARLDPTTVETQILQAKANLVRAQTDVERARITLSDADRKFKRSKELLEKKLVAQSDYDAAELTFQSAGSSLKSSEAALQQSEASLKQNEVNLEHTIIQSPIDGLVISRAMDVGQTVSASMSAPTLFTIAADLTKMKVIAGVDESDVGRIRPNQLVTFRVDAYPNRTFNGKVEQVRLEPKMQQNVVTYQTVITVPNPNLELKPGMTANLNIEISRVDNTLRIPNSALRFRPTNDMYTALGLVVPEETGRGGAGGGRGPGAGRQGGNGRDGAPATPGSAPAGQGQGRDGANSTSAAPTPRPASPPSRPAAAGAPPSTTAAANEGGGRAQAPELTPEMLARMNASRANGDPAAGGRGRGGQGFGGRGDQASADGQAAGGAQVGADGQGGRGRNRNGGQGGQGGFGGQGFGGQNGGRGGNAGGDPTAFGGSRGGNRPAGGGQNGFGGRGANASGQNAQGGRGGQQQDEVATIQPRGATTIDQLFPAIPRVEQRGRAWTWDKDKKELTSHNLRLGISDGQLTEVLDGGSLTEGSEVVTNIITAAAVRPAAGNPFLQGPGGGRGGPGGGFPGGGGGGGGNRGGGRGF